jgi:hypothetical protein
VATCSQPPLDKQKLCTPSIACLLFLLLLAIEPLTLFAESFTTE